MPENSVPAMGWHPMKSTSGGSTWDAFMTAVLMPHTSVTRLPSLKVSLYSFI